MPFLFKINVVFYNKLIKNLINLLGGFYPPFLFIKIKSFKFHKFFKG